MSEALGILCGFTFLLALTAWLVAVPIYLLMRCVSTCALVHRLENELTAFRRGERPQTVGPIPVLEAAEPENEVLPRAPEPATVQAARSPQIQRAPEPPRLPRRRRPPTPPPSPFAGIDLEAWIGKRRLGWIAVLLLFFATAFFIKYAFDNDLIGNLGRVALGVLAGAALAVIGYVLHTRRYRVFSQMFTSAGIILLYLTTFAAFAYYALIPQAQAGVFFLLIVTQTVVLAWLYDAPAIAIMAVIGGLLTPLVMYTGHDNYEALFTYLIILNLSAVALAVWRRWIAVGSVALLGTQLLFWIWYDANWHTEKLQAALLFQTVLFGLHLAPNCVAATLRRVASIEELLRLLANALLFTVAGYVTLDPTHHEWMGVFVLGVAIVHAGLGLLLSTRNATDGRHLLVVVAATLDLVAMVFPIQAKAAWIGLGWAVEGALLWWFGLRIRTVTLRAFGAVLLVMAVFRVLFIDSYLTGHEGWFVPFFNKYGTPATLIALCVLFCAAVSRLTQPRGLSLDHVGMWVAGVGGVLLLWFIVSFETYDFFMVQIDRRSAWADQGEIERLQSYARMFLSVVWALYAALILAIGYLRQSRPLRWTALGVFAVTLGKVLLVDTSGLGGLYRVGAFFILAVMMGLGAWIYQRIQFARPPGNEEGCRHETV